MPRSGDMSFWEHLDVLRGAIFRAFGVLALCSLVLFALKGILFDFVLAPLSAGFPLYRLPGLGLDMSLINIGITSQFFAHLKMSVLCGFVLAFPFFVRELWLFVSPALYNHERRAVGGAFLLSSLLFYCGVAVGYFVVLPVCLVFFMNYSVSPAIENAITLDSYISLFTSLVLLIGVVFEFPSFITALSHLGLVSRKTLRQGRRYAIVAVLILSALITPADPFSMFVLALPLYFLYELSIIICKKDDIPGSTDA